MAATEGLAISTVAATGAMSQSQLVRCWLAFVVVLQQVRKMCSAVAIILVAYTGSSALLIDWRANQGGSPAPRFVS